ncbi:hypothetical protein FRC00_007025 [Tulasnella sp. 408]|nr:hypothetical protein FRC00_007025 [Tulasnella sp. 408]
MSSPIRRTLALRSAIAVFSLFVIGSIWTYKSDAPLLPGSQEWSANSGQNRQAEPDAQSSASTLNAKYPPVKPIRPTVKISHMPGYTLLQDVYMANGTLYIVANDPKKWPPLNAITSSGYDLEWSDEERKLREPTKWHIDIVSEAEAAKRWGDSVWPVKDWTFFVNEPNQFLYHYYHWIGETFLGLVRLYSSLDPAINPRGETKLPDPARMILRHTSYDEWINWTPLNWYATYSAWPSMTVETINQWEQRAYMTRDNHAVWRFENMLIADRGASFRYEKVPGRNHRTAWSAWEGTQNVSSRWWWEPVRRSVLRAAHVDEKIVDRPSIWADWKGSFIGDYPPTQKDLSIIKEAHQLAPVVITYVSRQNGGRRLLRDDDLLLVKSLKELTTRRGWKFNHAFMEKMSPEEQLKLAGETTILIGVHGNGLTHLVWLPLTPITTVIEIYYPGAFSKDYEWTARALGMTHYAVWNDTAFTHPNEPKVEYPPEFHGDSIPAHGPSIARIIENRIDGKVLDTKAPTAT